MSQRLRAPSELRTNAPFRVPTRTLTALMRGILRRLRRIATTILVKKIPKIPMRTDPLAFLGTELDTLRQQGLYRHLRVLDDRQQATAHFDGRSVVNLSSNNYLGLTTHPKLVEAALKATREFGVGSGSVRTIAGTMAIHMELERRLAAF